MWTMIDAWLKGGAGVLEAQCERVRVCILRTPSKHSKGEASIAARR